MRSKSKAAIIALALLPAAVCSSCFTGVESTPRITATEIEKKPAHNAGEQSFLTDISGESPAAWQPGKRFCVTDSRIGLIFDPGAPALHPGDVIAWSGATESLTITGEPQVEMRFTDPSGAPMTYRSDGSLASLAERKVMEIPFTVELSVVDSVRTRVLGNTYYILTSMWYDLGDQSFTGQKYVPVTVKEVLPGNSVYPVKLIMTDSRGVTFALFMSVGSNLKAPRGFSKLFSFTDPRLRYPAITDEVWTNIINNRVSPGMTLDECRLALGSPAKVSRRPDHSVLREIWSYENGIYLMFVDGLLTSYRR